MFGFLKADGPVVSKKLAGLDRARTESLAVRTRLGLGGGFRLLGGGLFGESLSDSATDLMSTLFDGGEIELAQFLFGAEEILRDFTENLLESRVQGRVRC